MHIKGATVLWWAGWGDLTWLEEGEDNVDSVLSGSLPSIFTCKLTWLSSVCTWDGTWCVTWILIVTLQVWLKLSNWKLELLLTIKMTSIAWKGLVFWGNVCNNYCHTWNNVTTELWSFLWSVKKKFVMSVKCEAFLMWTVTEGWLKFVIKSWFDFTWNIFNYIWLDNRRDLTVR